ncbi:unnamed protein product, partial [Ectocarpus fasciculatus]
MRWLRSCSGWEHCRASRTSAATRLFMSLPALAMTTSLRYCYFRRLPSMCLMVRTVRLFISHVGMALLLLSKLWFLPTRILAFASVMLMNRRWIVLRTLWSW